MKVQIQDKEALDSLTVASLRAYLESHGWSNDRPWGTWSTILSKEERGKTWEVAVPNEAGGLLYAEIVAEIIATLAEVEDRSQLDVFQDLAGEGADTAAAPLNGSGKEGDNMTTPKLARLERVDLREEWKTEAQDFTPWLAHPENLAVLSDTLGMELATEGTEQGVGPFRADILCRDTQDDSLVLIENQLERTDHNHLGQLLTYAAGLQTVTIIWVSATFTDEHRAALDWLNEITDSKFRFFGLEIELWRIGDSPAAPKFNVVSRPNNWSKTTQLINKEISSSGLQHQRFWTQLREYLDETASRIKLTRMPQPQHHANFGIGKSGFRLAAVRYSQGKHISVQLQLRSSDAKAHFGPLQQMQSEIEKEIGHSLTCLEQPDSNLYSRISLSYDCNPSDEENWPEQINWIADKLQKFDLAFRQRVKDVDASEQLDGESFED